MEYTPLVWAIAASIMVTFCVALFVICKINPVEIKISKSDSFIIMFSALCNMGKHRNTSVLNF